MPPEVRYEKPRGCGYRKEDGLYLVCDGEGRGCGLLPLAVDKCPTCGGGIKPSQSWTWIDAKELFAGLACSDDGTPLCASCPVPAIDRAGLIWVGSRYYQTPEKFQSEARQMGISRRITAVPKDFVIGETQVFLAHRQCIEQTCPDCDGDGLSPRDDEVEHQGGCERCKSEGKILTPGIFCVFRPQRIEKVVGPDIDDDEIEALARRQITPVVVKQLDASGTPDFPFMEPMATRN